jgi:2-methylcitrate dehydratase PrpD
MDDVDRRSVLHPGAVVIPAALAVAEQQQSNGRSFLSAVVLGYEVAIRLGESVGPRHYFYWHNTSTCGVYGAAAAAGWLLGLDRERLTWALGNAGTQASGLWQFNQDGAMSKPLHAGRAAANGVLAAQLAACGLTGARRILEGTQGFWAATAPDGDPQAVTRGLGSGAWKLAGVSIKPYPSCRHTHSAIDAALRLRERLGAVQPEQIARLEIAGYKSMLDLCDNPHPTSSYSAKFSVQYTTARALLSGRPRLEDFDEQKIAAPDVRTILERSDVQYDARLDGLYPAQFPARVTVKLANGDTHAEVVLSPKGDPENPMSREELESKFVELLAGSPYAGREQWYFDDVRQLAGRSRMTGFLSLPESDPEQRLAEIGSRHRGSA